MTASNENAPEPAEREDERASNVRECMACGAESERIPGMRTYYCAECGAIETTYPSRSDPRTQAHPLTNRRAKPV